MLDAEKAFVSLSLFNTIKQPMTMLPVTVSNLIQVRCFEQKISKKFNICFKVFFQANVALTRITNFLLREEVNTKEITHEPKDATISLESCSFGWDHDKIYLKE